MRYTMKGLKQAIERNNLQYCTCRFCTRKQHILNGLPVTLFQAQLSGMTACVDARQWVWKKTARQAWEQCKRADWMYWLASALLGGSVLEALDIVSPYDTCQEMRDKLPWKQLRTFSEKRR